MTIRRPGYRLYLSEAIGTAVLLFFGMSIIIFNWGEGSDMEKWFPSLMARRILTGFLFGCVGCLISISPVGRISGAHINPAVSMAFWLRGKMKTTAMMGYIFGQMIGAALGCLPLFFWGKQGNSIHYGITLPGKNGLWVAFTSEVLATAALISYLYIFIGRKKLRKYTPYGIPLLYAILNIFFAEPSGDSTNPARSFGPAVISGNFTHYWLYWVAPAMGVILVTLYFRRRRINHYYEMEKARISYHNSPTPEALTTGELRDAT